MPVLGLLLFIVPAISYGCSDAEPHHDDPSSASEQSVTRTSVTLSGSGSLQGSVMDVFTFNDDELQRLDSYTRIESFEGERIHISSQSGRKSMFICANCPKDIYGWSEISSTDNIRSMKACLEDESRDRMLMSGIVKAVAGETAGPVVLSPIGCEVVLRSISCDFSGLPYSGKEITEAKAYLTNVNAEVSIFAETDKDRQPSRIINTGMLNDDDLKHFKDPGLVYQKVADRINGTVIRPDIRFMCYPNTAAKEGIGTPFTRLVIEGKVEGCTYYWPIDINRKDGGKGLERNSRYIFDILLKRKGTSDPEIPVKWEEAESLSEVRPWNEKQEERIEF